MKAIKRTALAAAVAMGSASGAQAVDFQIDDRTTFEINIDVEYFYDSKEVRQEDGSVDSVSEFGDDDSELDFKGYHTFRNARFGEVTAFLETEFNFEADDDDGSAGPGIGDTEEANIGLESSRFGGVIFGMWDSYYDDNIQDNHDIYQVTDPTEASQSDFEDAVGYSTPGIPLGLGTFKLMGAVSFKGDGDSSTPDLDEDGNVSNEEAYQAVATYEYEWFKLAVGYDDQGTIFEDSDGLFGASAVFDLAPYTVVLRAEREGDTGQTDSTGRELDDDQTLLGVAVAYDYGGGELLGSVHQIDEGDDRGDGDSRTEVLFGANYVIGNGFGLFTEARLADKEDDVDDRYIVGMEYDF